MAEAAQDAAGHFGQGAPPPRRLSAFGEGEMDEAGGGRERRSAGRFGQPADAERAADADLLVEDERGEFARAGSWQAPPVSTMRRPAILSKPLCSNRSRTSSKGSSRRGEIMPTSSDFGTWWAWPSSSSPTCGTEMVSRSSAADAMALP